MNKNAGRYSFDEFITALRKMYLNDPRHNTMSIEEYFDIQNVKG